MTSPLRLVTQSSSQGDGLRSTLPAHGPPAASEVYTSADQASKPCSRPRRCRKTQACCEGFSNEPGFSAVRRGHGGGGLREPQRQPVGASAGGPRRDDVSGQTRPASLTLYDERDVSAGEMAFADGLLVDAKCGRLVGAKAFYALLALSEGSFSVDSDFEPPVASQAWQRPRFSWRGCGDSTRPGGCGSDSRRRPRRRRRPGGTSDPVEIRPSLRISAPRAPRSTRSSTRCSILAPSVSMMFSQPSSASRREGPWRPTSGHVSS